MNPSGGRVAWFIGPVPEAPIFHSQRVVSNPVSAKRGVAGRRGPGLRGDDLKHGEPLKLACPG